MYRARISVGDDNKYRGCAIEKSTSAQGGLQWPVSDAIGRLGSDDSASSVCQINKHSGHKRWPSSSSPSSRSRRPRRRNTRRRRMPAIRFLPDSCMLGIENTTATRLLLLSFPARPLNAPQKQTPSSHLAKLHGSKEFI